jgi:PAT family beta-lactamase induction signal transducer AmpG
MFGAVVLPMMELIGRMGWATVSALLLILTYRFADSIWGSFAYPFYMGSTGGALGHTATEVALASKMIGVAAVIAGIVAGGVLVRLMGRMPALVLAAVLAAATNLLFADLARGAPSMDAFLGLTRLDDLYAVTGLDLRMARLTTAIMGENLAVGFASVVYVAYLSSIVNPRFAAVQYALLGSLTMLIGQLGRPAVGAMIEVEGFASVFVLTALLGLVPVGLSMFEWLRQSRETRSSGLDTQES